MDYEAKWKEERERAAFLALADGTVLRGVAFGARRDALGEAVFNTGVVCRSKCTESGAFTSAN
ncbi:MAG: hypothetical protein IJ783_01175 [Kiritimatiellae bacterium]|nr:hypothetical protein [Kiritimatiellia bacterium]